MSGLLAMMIGIVLFVGGHFVTRMRGLRAALIEGTGPNVYRGLYSLVAVMGIFMIAHGFKLYRLSGMIPVWEPPRFLTHLAMLLVWVSFILMVAAYTPGRIKARAKHPMLAGVKLWALAHLLVNGDLGSIILFTALLAWAVIARIALKKAGDRGGLPHGLPATATRNDIIAIVVGTIGTIAFVYVLHKMLIGVALIGV